MTRHTTPVLDGLAYFGVEIKKVTNNAVWVKPYMETISGDRYVGRRTELLEGTKFEFGVKRRSVPQDWRKAE